MKKKIAIVSDAVYPFNKGGKEKRIYDIATRLVDQGNDVTIYCMQWWKGDKTLTKDGITFHAISPYYPLYAGPRRSIREAIFFALHCFAMISKDFDVIDVDHMPHTTLFVMKIVCLLKGKKMTTTWHEVWGEEYWKKYAGSVKGAFAYYIERLSVHLPDTIISVSEHTTKNLKNVLGRTRSVITVPNSLDVASIQRISPSKIKSDIIFAGRLLAHKNVDVLLRAIAIVKEKKPAIKAIIIGEGPEKDRLRKLANALHLGNNVTFMDFFTDHDSLYSLMHASKVFVLPSVREGFGLMVVEADACGLPVIAIDHPHNAAKDLVIQNGNGILCELTPEAVAKATETMLARRKNAEFYIQYAQKYDWSHAMPQLAKIWNERP